MLRMLIKDLRISPLRTFLTGFSMFVGIVAVILSVLSGTVGQAYFTATNEQLYGREPTVSVHVSDLSDASYAQLSALNADLQQRFPPSALSITPESNYFTGLLTTTVAVSPGAPLTAAQVLAAGSIETRFVSPEYNRIFNLPMTSGRWLLRDEDARFEVVINKVARDQLQDLSGIAVVSNQESLNFPAAQMVGVVNDGLDRPLAYLNVLSSAFYLQDTWSATSLAIEIWNRSGLSDDQLRSGISDALADSTGGRIDQISDNQGASAFEDATIAMQWGFALCAALLLFVSCIGLINIGLASLEQRSRELVIRRALGATRASVAFLVLGGSLLLAIVVATIAVGLAALLVAGIPMILPADTPVSPPAFPVSAAYISVTAAVLTALAGSLVPALRAAGLQPALALR